MLVCGTITGVANAACIAWNPTETPTVSLGLALALAGEEPETTGEMDLHFLSSSFVGPSESHFGSEAGKQLRVAVGRARKVWRSTRAVTTQSTARLLPRICQRLCLWQESESNASPGDARR